MLDDWVLWSVVSQRARARARARWRVRAHARGTLRFHPAPVPTVTDMAEILGTIVPAVQRLLSRHGLDGRRTSPIPFAEAAPLLAGWAAASVEGLVVAGPSGSARRALAPRAPAVRLDLPSCHARWEGFDLHAGVRIPAGQRDRLERVCRYASGRPWPVTVCTSRAPAMSPSNSGGRGRMAPRISCSHRWRFWRAWPSWCLARG